MNNGKFPKPSRYAIKGGGTFSDKADNVILIWRENRNEKGDTGVTFISEKIKKRKLTGITGETSFNFDFIKNRYMFEGHDPLSLPTEIKENENHWKSISSNTMFEEIKNDDLPNNPLFDIEPQKLNEYAMIDEYEIKDTIIHKDRNPFTNDLPF